MKLDCLTLLKSVIAWIFSLDLFHLICGLILHGRMMELLPVLEAHKM